MYQNVNSTPVDLVPVPFHGHEIASVCDTRGGEYEIPFRPVCDRLKLAFNGQLERLKRQHWAVVRVTRTTGADGKFYEMTVVSRKTFAMWLATITASRIKDPEARKLVELYQAEAVDALDRHFFGGAPLATAAPAKDPRLAQLEILTDLVHRQIEQEQRLAAIETTAATAAAKADLAITTVAGTTDFVSVLGYCKTRGISIPEPKMAQAGRAATGICKLEGIEYRQSHHERWGTVGIYPITVLDRVFDRLRSA